MPVLSLYVHPRPAARDGDPSSAMSDLLRRARESEYGGAMVTLRDGRTIGLALGTATGRSRAMRSHERRDYNLSGRRISEETARQLISEHGTRDSEQFVESEHPRSKSGEFAKSGSGGGGNNGSGGSSSGVALTPHAKAHALAKLLSGPVRGTGPERVALKAALNENVIPHVRSMIAKRIMESYRQKFYKLQKAGKDEEAAKVAKKGAKYGKYVLNEAPEFTPSKIEDPQTPQPAQAASLPPKYSKAESQYFYDLASAVGENKAKSYNKFAAGQLSGPAKHLSKTLNVAEAAHIVAYTGNEFGETNRSLRSGAMSEERWRHVRMLNRALEKLPDYKGTVYRRAYLDPELAMKYEPGMVIEERAFTSTTHVEIFPPDYKFVIQSETGKSVERLSMNPQEEEILFRSGTRFKIIKREGKEIHMKELPL